MKENTILANRIKTVRRNSDMTQEHMAEQLGISRSTLACWENATRQPSTSELVNFCKQFSVTFDYMCGRTEEAQMLVGQKCEIDWSKLSPIGRLVLCKIYQFFIVTIPLCSLKSWQNSQDD